MSKQNNDDRLSVAVSRLYDAQSLIKFGALSTESCVTDEELQINGVDEFYQLLKLINAKIDEAIKIINL